MPSFSKSFTTLTGMGFGYLRDSHLAARTFNQNGVALYNNNPRFPFEYYININIDQSSPSITEFVTKFLNNVQLTQVMPLVKSIDMPAAKIQTDVLNQYNRRRLNQTKIDFDPVKVVFHDVADGKTLRFWEMYYRYYFLEGLESGTTDPKHAESQARAYGIKFNKDLLSLPTAIGNIFNNQKPKISAQNQNGQKAKIDAIVSGQLDNHNFGYNIQQVKNIRQLITSIEIVMTHGGRYNKVTLVNPKISAFSQDPLNYAEIGKTSEITMTFEYEYAYYQIANQLLSETDQARFDGSDFLELPALSFNSRLLDFMEQNNPLFNTDNEILRKIGRNVQTEIGGVTGKFLSEKVVSKVSSSVLNGMAKISPLPVHPTPSVTATSRSFVSTAGSPLSPAYPDATRIPLV